MNNVLGIISEYNPFHNGHLYHIEESKKLTHSDLTVAIMTGNFTQRGVPSIIDKWSRAEAALASGVDLVIELPVLYSISSAENFADGAIKILNSLQLVDYLSFGAETDDVAALDIISNVLCSEPREYKNILSHELSKGISYPKARENALMMYLNDVRRFASILSGPNNILGIEYLKALKRQKSKIVPLSVKRKVTSHNDKHILKSATFASGSAIRNAISFGKIDELKNVMPTASLNILLDNMKKGHIVKDISAFDKEILFTLRKMTVEEIANLPDVSEGLEYAIKSAANSCNSTVELLTMINTKRYAKTRIQRILLYALLGISKKDMDLSKNIVPYIRVLGFNKNGKYLLSQICNNPKIQIITSLKPFIDNCSNKNLKAMLEKDIWATNVYTLGYEYGSMANLDYTHKLITL